MRRWWTAARAGRRISPKLAGRVAAAFALGAQVEAGGDRKRARGLLEEGAWVFVMARTTGVGELVSAFPPAWYPEDSWQDDMGVRRRRAGAGRPRPARPPQRAWLRAATLGLAVAR